MSREQPALLIVEDDSAAARQLRWTFDDYDVTLAGDREEAVAALNRRSYPVVLLDLGLPPDPDGVTEGLACLQEIVTLAPHSRVIVVTGQHEHEHALADIRLGAHDFYNKPIDADELRLLTRRNADLHALDSENRRRASAAGEEVRLPGVVSASDAMRAVEGLIGRAARTEIGVMLLGESGVGKEVLARALHALSARSGESFSAIHCGAIPETLLESELFGYEKGAFTGAEKTTLGHIEAASGGTLLLDEIGDMPRSMPVPRC
jgi:two-component system NtrC family response regulator